MSFTTKPTMQIEFDTPQGYIEADAVLSVEWSDGTEGQHDAPAWECSAEIVSFPIGAKTFDRDDLVAILSNAEVCGIEANLSQNLIDAHAWTEDAA